MSTQQSKIRTATVEENAEALWKAAEALGMSKTDYVKACTLAVAEMKVGSLIATPEPDFIAEDGSAEGPHSTLTPGR